MKKSKFFIFLLVALMCFVAVFFVACDGDDETEDNKSYVCDEHDWVLKGYISYDSHLYKCNNCYIVKVVNANNAQTAPTTLFLLVANTSEIFAKSCPKIPNAEF